MRNKNRSEAAFAALVVVGWIGLASPLSAAVLSEATGGDLSNNRQTPTPFTLGLGVNSLIGTTGSGDRDYVRLDLPAGGALQSLVLRSFSGLDGVAFLGMQRGTTFTENPDSANPANLLGYAHFGTSSGNVGSNLLPSMGRAGAQGFTPPLTGPAFTLWIQQLGSPSSYQFDLTATPEPACGLFLVGCAGFMVARRRR